LLTIAAAIIVNVITRVPRGDRLGVPVFIVVTMCIAGTFYTARREVDRAEAADRRAR